MAEAEDPMSLIRDEHGGAVSVRLQMGEILVGVDENADTGKDRPHFVSFKPHQVAELALALVRRLTTAERKEFWLKLLDLMSTGGGSPST
jgi:hypothetical protein